MRLTATEVSRYCPECERLTRELVEAKAAHGYALLKATEAYQQGFDQGAAHVAVDIVTWLEDSAAEDEKGPPMLQRAGALKRIIAAGIMDGAHEKEEEEDEAPAHD